MGRRCAFVGQCAGKSAGGGWPVVPGTTRVDAGDDAVPPRVPRGSGGACARRDSGGNDRTGVRQSHGAETITRGLGGHTGRDGHTGGRWRDGHAAADNTAARGRRALGRSTAHAASGRVLGDDVAAHGDWVGASGTRRTFNGGLGAVQSVEHGVGVCSPCAAPPTSVCGVPWSSHRHLRVWWPALRVSGVCGCNRVPWWPVAVAAPAGVDRRRRGRRWAALATCGGGRHWRRAEVGLVAGMVVG